MKSKKHTAKLMPAVLLALVLLLAACTPGGGEGGAWEPVLEQEPEPGKETLVLASLSSPGAPRTIDREAVLEFNRTHADVQIVVKNYWKEGGNGAEGVARLLTELAVGQVPDIIDLGGLPYRQMVRKGYLEDLWPWIENDPDLGRDGVLEAPLKAAEVDGKLCAAFGEFSIRTLVGAADQVGDRTSWTLAELQEAFAAMPEESTVLELGAVRESAADDLLPLVVDTYMDREAGTCNFDAPGFRAVLEFLNSFPSDEGMPVLTTAEEVKAFSQEQDAWRLSGHQMLERCYGMGVSSLLSLNVRHGGRCAFVGYPMEDGSVGSLFVAEGPRLAMASTCRNKEAAWELIRTVMLPLYDPIGEKMPIRRDYYEMKKNRYMKGEQFAHLGLWQKAVEVPPLTGEEVERFEDFLNSIDRIIIGDDPVYDLILESCGPYFAGDKTLDETVALVQNRVTLYVNENR